MYGSSDIDDVIEDHYAGLHADSPDDFCPNCTCRGPHHVDLLDEALDGFYLEEVA